MKKTTFIILAWVLVCCGFSHQSYAQVNQVNPDSNISRVAQTQTTSVRSGITTSNYAFNQDNSGLIVPSNWDNVAGTATRLSTPIANQNRVPVTITHSASQTIGIGSVACGTAGVNAENHYFRDFDLANDFGIAGDFNVTAAEFGVQEATDPVVVTVNIWSSTGVAFPGGTLVLEGTATYTSTPADLGTVVSVPVTATIPAGAVMVFEFVQADGSAWRIGSNDIGQTGVSWILADACGITNPTNGTAIGFPDFHLVMNVVGEEAGGGLVALPVDFELPAGSYDFVGFEGADSVVEANPDMTGNPSATVMRTTKTAGAQFFAGTALNLDTPIDFSTTEMVSMKSWSPKDNIPVRMRLENADNSVGIEMDVNTAVMNGWETLTYDFTGMTGGTDFVRVVVFFEFIVGLAGDGSTYYYDDIQTAQTPPPPPTDCNIYASTAAPFDIDGTETQTADCAVAPNLVPVTVTESGLIGTGVNIDNVTVDIAHTWSADLQLTLVSPSGASLLLANELGGNDDDAYNNTIFMDGGADITMATAPYNAAPFAAEGGAFATAFAGEEVNGDWQLQVCDGAAGDTGTVLAFSLTICSDDVPPPPACVTSTATVVPFDIDGTETQTADCAVAPNLVPVTVAESGLIGTGANIDNVTVDIAHTWSADLQLTLVSPSGASLLLANELGGNDDDAYNNTIFMDGGADITMATAPYNTAPFAAEGGAFATAFAGEEINGDWQLQVCDGAAGDTGTVLAFSLTICSNAPPPTCMETAATAVPLDIDGAGNVTADCAVAPNLVPVTIAESGIIGTDVVLDFAQIDILHTFSADLDLFLVSPLGTELLLSDDNGGGTDDGYNMTQFSDGGADITAATAPFGTGPYAAEGGSFAVAFNGEEINGDWQLKVCDDAGGDTGSVQAFSLQFCPPPTCPEVINIVVTPTLTDAAISWDAQAAATNGYIVDVFADGADPMTATPVYNEILAAGTTMTTATGLMASTSYDLYVTSDCGASGLSSVNPVDFTTLIAPPACGGKFYDTGGPDNDFDNNEAYQVNILPDNAGDLVTASFVFVDTGGGGFDILLVDIGDGTGFQQVPEVAMGDTPVVFTSAAADGSLLFDFFSSGVVPNPGWDADITCNPPPACPSPSGFIVDNITATTADLSWNEVANASNGYIASVFNAGDDPLTATPVYTEMVASGTTMTVATGLMQTTSYDAYIQADCDADGFSLTDMVSFNTLQEPPACGNEFFDTGGTDNPYQNNEDISFLIVADSPDNIITLDFTFVEIEDNFDFLRVFDGDDATAPELSDAVLGVQNIGQIASTIPGGNLFVTFTSDGSVTQGGWAANVICVPPPPCPTPTGINLSNVMAESVDISWNAVAEAINGYRVAVFATGDDPTTDTPAFAEDTMMLMSTATGLTNNTTYDLYIVSLCDNMVTSGLIPIISFTTDVLGLDDAAVEGFTYFPNPSSDVLNLSATNNIDTVSIYNLLGQVVLSQKVNATSSQLNISEFSTGSYIMKVTSNGVTGSYKVIKR
ncbi:proprotein convertase P-domain-containing protein [Patiriisocius sp. Uisw_017]|jgi:subtilisin-like proprotein convertase family protein|uniref:proprotein convertase P-domain-containing protein n=1 Tax=Patiriisocius sp. Uisw_017 TaxID=3230968 RepID=UPI0039E8729E